jgi:ubiquinone/menaquinone biosynthesis C-methylase UbiE
MVLEKEVREFWNKEAPLWTEQKPLGNIGVLIKESIRQYVRCLLPMIPRNGPILDLGAGAGTMEYFDKENLNRIISLDFSEEMLLLNTTNKKVNSSVNEKLPFKSDSIAFITSFFVMRYQSKMDHLRMATEFSRVLLPGGAVLIVDVSKNNYPYQQSVFEADKLGEVMIKMGYESVSSKENNFLTHSSRRIYGSLTSASIKVLFGFKPLNSCLKEIDEKSTIAYLESSGQ